ncbi:DEAD/DEAH box helicase family protein [Empedobacter sp.]|uniref:DEAD/DEAH box helicase family protein n=1 Tax=Empedobacter sp. TaxID=1927715 RepID=UPI0028A1C1CF|nr:DEAD/DEAH box helicase family protein [Empedobacter sp.]
MKIIEVNELLDTPIDYKQIDESNFIDSQFEKVNLEVDENGYVSNSILDKIDFNSTDTTVINAGVGLGKTEGILRIIQHYHNERFKGNHYKLIIVTPFKSLNRQYIKAIQEIINKDNIHFNYEDIDLESWDENKAIEDSKKSLQIFSIKSILGDSGNVIYEQNINKSRYIDLLINQCKVRNEKVVFIFDEIHETLSSYDKKNILNLLKWKNVTFKAIVASATFSESSIVVLKLIQVLTDNRIKILEIDRVQNDRLSALNLVFYNRPTYDVNDDYLNSFFDELLQKDFETINILSYSKKLAQSIFESELKSKMDTKYSEINLCIGDGNGKFNHNESNIGTTFKTGLSITKKTALILLLPTIRSEYYGIFEERINPLIQALARARNPESEVYIIMPKPKSVIANFYYYDHELNGLNRYKSNRYLPISEQQNYLENRFKRETDKNIEEIKELEVLPNGLKTNVEPFDWYRLTYGDKVLYSNVEIYGKDLPSYVYWAAINNQFVNTRLRKIILKDDIIFEEDNFIPDILKFLNDNNLIEELQTLTDKELYYYIRESLFSNKLYIRNENKEDEPIIIIKNRNSLFEYQILQSVNIIKNNIVDYTDLVDNKITKEEYLRNAISYCLNIESLEGIDKECYSLIRVYNDLYMYQNIFLEKYARDSNYFEIDNDFKFHNVDLIKLMCIFDEINQKDKIFVTLFRKNKMNDKYIFSLLKKVFFTTKQTKVNSVKLQKIESVFDLTDTNNSLNLVY